MKRLPSIVAALLVACGSDSTSPKSSIGGVVIVSAGASSLHQQETTLAQSSGGRMVVVWIGFLDQTTTFAATIEYVISDDAGKTWSKPAAVALPPGFGILNDPALAVDATGNFTLAALAFELPGQQPHSGVYVYSLPNGAKTFSAPAPVDTLQQSALLYYFDKPQITTTGSGLLVTYSLVGAGPGGVPTSKAGIAATSAAGGTWQHDTIATNGPVSIALCPAGQSVTAIYLAATGGVWTTPSSDGGITWGSPAELDAGGTGASMMPACARRANDEWVLYGTSPSTIALAHSSDAGGHFSPVPIAINGSAGRAQLALRDDGTIDIAFYNSNPTLSFGFVHALLPPGSSALDAPEVLRAGIQIPQARQVQNGLADFVGVVPGGIAFTDNSSGTSHIAFFRETP